MPMYSFPTSNVAILCGNTIAKARRKNEKKLLPLRFHGEEVLDSNFQEVYGKEGSHKKSS
jgi:hypothetical protein